MLLSSRALAGAGLAMLACGSLAAENNEEQPACA
jgi:hypothetical protein